MKEKEDEINQLSQEYYQLKQNFKMRNDDHEKYEAISHLKPKESMLIQLHQNVIFLN